MGKLREKKPQRPSYDDPRSVKLGPPGIARNFFFESQTSSIKTIIPSGGGEGVVVGESLLKEQVENVPSFGTRELEDNTAQGGKGPTHTEGRMVDDNLGG